MLKPIAFAASIILPFLLFSGCSQGSGGGGGSPGGSGTAPTDITLSAATVAEKSPAGTLIGNLAAVDPDAGDSASFSLPAGVQDNDSFGISGNKLQAKSLIKYSAGSTRHVTVRATDSGSMTFDKSFTIVLTERMGLFGTWYLSAPSSRTVAFTDDAAYVLEGASSSRCAYLNLDIAARKVIFPYSGIYVMLNWDSVDPSSAFSASGSVQADVWAGIGGVTLTCTQLNANPLAPIALGLDTGPAIVQDGAASGTTIGNLRGIDTIASDAYTYTLVPGAADNSDFSVTGSVLKINVVPHFAIKNPMQLLIKVANSDGYSADLGFPVFVTAPVGTSFELEGAWTANWFGPNDMIFTKTAFTVTGSNNVSAQILWFDAATKKGMLVWTVHPAFAGQYENFHWSADAVPGNMDLILGTPAPTYADAAASTASAYTATLVPKP
jgi:hypothetical protein